MHVHSLLPTAGLITFAILSSAATIAQKRDLVISSNLPTKWSYSGCYSDSTGARALANDGFHDDIDMTENKCIQYCDQRQYPVAGVEYSRECFCGFSLGASGIQQPESDCNMACSSGNGEKCGGPARLNVFTNGAKPPSTNPGPDGWSSLGCYSDSASYRTLSTSMNVNGPMTVAACTAACDVAGFDYAGVEFGKECYCGKEISIDGAPATSGCNTACAGNKAEWCGGAGRINVYQSTLPPAKPGQLPPGWSPQGCYTDRVSGRSLGVVISIPPSDVTIEACLTACGNLSYTYAGVEWAQECFCDNQIKNGGCPASSGCNMACKGNRAETCGGSERLNLFKFA